MSKDTFKMIDITIFSIIAIILEIAIYFGSQAVNSVSNLMPVFVSFSIILSLISIYRWGVIGSLVCVCGGLASAFAQQSSTGTFELNLYLIYGIGNACVGLSYILLLKGGRKKISSRMIYLVGYELFGYLAVIIGRSIIILLIMHNSFTDNLLAFVGPECMGFVIGMLVLNIANKPNGVLVEMNEYIKSVHDEMREDKLHLKAIKESDSYDAISDVTKKSMINDASLLDGGNLNQNQLDELQLLYDESLSEKGEEQKNNGKND